MILHICIKEYIPTDKRQQGCNIGDIKQMSICGMGMGTYVHWMPLCEYRENRINEILENELNGNNT